MVTCSTTSNYYHVLRRQLRRSFRKPLINFNSKKLLKFKGVTLYLISGKQTHWRHFWRKGVHASNRRLNCKSQQSAESPHLQWSVLLRTQGQKRRAEERGDNLIKFRMLLLSELSRLLHSLTSIWRRLWRSTVQMLQLTGCRRSTKTTGPGLTFTRGWPNFSTKRFDSLGESHRLQRLWVLWSYTRLKKQSWWRTFSNQRTDSLKNDDQ